MVLAVLSRITGNLSLIFVLCGKFIYLETVGIPLLRYFHPKGLRVLYEVGHSFWKLFPTHHFPSSERARSKKTKTTQKTCSLSRTASFTSFVMEVNLQVYGPRIVGGG